MGAHLLLYFCHDIRPHSNRRDSKYSWDGDKQLNNLTAGQYTLDIAGTQDAKGTYALEMR